MSTEPAPAPQATASQAITGDPVAAAWAKVAAWLERRKAAIYEEIGAYPPPIPACDAQFNHLLEERSGIHREIGRLDAARRESAPGPDPIAPIEAFIDESAFIGESAGRELKSALRPR